MTRDMLEKNGYELHHTALKRGYVSRRLDPDDCTPMPYNGKFGKGYTVELPNFHSTRYCILEYWIKKEL